MARGSNLTIRLKDQDVPFFQQAEALAREGFITGASIRNWASYGDSVSLPDGLPDWRRNLLTDPQTSGGLLIACADGQAEDVLRAVQSAGFPRARIVGSVHAGDPRVEVVVGP
jgi:selenide,water dikinase